MKIETSFKKYFISVKRIKKNSFNVGIDGNKKAFEFSGNKESILNDLKNVFDMEFIKKIETIINKLENL